MARAGTPARHATTVGARASGARRAAIGGIVCAVIFGLTTHAKFSVDGDEPHYLLVAHSLVADGDFDLANNYAAGDAGKFGREGLGSEHHAIRVPSGALRPVHDVGLPVVLAPVYFVASRIAPLAPVDLLARFHMTPGSFTYALISLALLVVTVTGLMVLHTAIAVTALPARADAVVLALGLAPPVLCNAFLVYPEIPALLLAAWVVKLGWTAPDRLRLRAMALAAAGLGLLPWMHRKFIPFAAGLLFVLAWRHRAWLGRLAFSTVAGLALLIVVPVIAQSLSTAATWGDAGGPLLREGLPFSWHALQRGAPGLLFDRENGLFVWAPIYLIMPAAWWITRRETWPLLVPALLLYLPSAAHDAWWGGWSPVGRFLLPLVPLAAVPAVRALAAPTIRRAALALLMPQAVMSAMAWQMPHVLWPRGQGVNLGLAAIPVVGARVQAWLPSLRHEGVDARLWAALAIVLAGNAALALFGRRALAGGGPPSAGA